MTEPVDPTPGAADLSPVKRALLEIRELRARLAAVQSAAHAAAHEPIAIVGLGLRLPGGVVDLESLWQVLRDGVDTIGPVPPARWDAQRFFDADPDHPGTMWTTQGGFLERIDLFDAAFFGIAPREAERMDPQQRLMLELAWETLEHAGIAPDRLAGSATGVFVGVGNTDYFRRLFSRPELIDAYAGSGGSAAVIAGRISYQLGLQGPSLAVDTACSASLVAVHLACQSLRRGECELALAGGVNLIAGPEAHIAFTKARMMAADGRCKTFDASADGYGRAEGGGLLALRRLSDAQARGDRILAVVRGSAVNQDGRSAGLTAPNGPAQTAVIRAALADAGLTPAEVDLVEAHGTGTPLGDPIELQALGEALGDARAAPLVVGSCKTNFGHLEAAAGIAGLAKLVAALGHGEVPPHLHLKQPNPRVDWPQLALRVNTALEPWPHAGEVRRAGVSSFGFSGTNAHVLLESVPSRAPAPGVAEPETALTDRPRHLLALSATTDAALRELARRTVARIDRGDVTLADLCFSANTGRAQLPRRLAVVAADLAELREALDGFGEGREGQASPRLRHGGATAGATPTVGLLFTGQGAQYPGMGRALDAASPTFRGVIDECAAVLDPLLPRPLRTLLFAEGAAALDANGQPWLARTDCAQPALLALEMALLALWRRWGVQPALVLGHSLGEIAAACAAGVFTLPDALRLVATRGRLMQRADAGPAVPAGAMATVFAPATEVAALARAHGVEVAAFNGPAQTVLSGPAAAIEHLIAAADAAGWKHHRLAVAHAFHSAAMDPVLDEFEREVATLPRHAPQLTLVSNLTGQPADAATLAEARYWRRHLREPVKFEASMRSAPAAEATHWLEIGPAPVLTGMAARFVDLPGDRWLASLRPKADDWSVLLGALQQLWVDGADIDWAAFDADHARLRVDVPTMAWQRRRYWFDLPEETPGADPLHAWRSIAAALDRASGQGPIGVDLSGYDRRWACLERLTVAAATKTLRDAGCFMKPGERASVEDVRQRLGAAETYRHLLQRWLERLMQRGLLQHEGGQFVAAQPLPDPKLTAALQEAEQALAGNQPLLDYLRHCCGLLGAVIGGRESALETLFPGGSFDLAEGLYERSATGQFLNGLAATALQAMVASRPGHAWRVLEAGAGTGGSTSALLPLLPAGSSYVFTDVSEFFLERAGRKFAAHPALRLATFDLEAEPAAQGLAEGSFDLVLAANAVHAVRDLRAVLARLRRLLAPGGMLMLMEATEHLAWFDISTGLIEGWQAFDDDLRTDQPLLTPPQWVGALHDAGFEPAQAWPPAGSAASLLAAHVVIARVPGVAVGAHAGSPAGGGEGQEGARAPGATATASAARPNEPQAAAWRERLREALPAERVEALRELVRERVMAVLRLDADQAPGPGDRLLDLGFDSLMAVQLRGQIGDDLGLAKGLPATLLFDHPTIADMAAYLLQHLAAGAADPATPSPAGPGADPADGPGPAATPAVAEAREAEVAAMSDDEVEALLMQRLGAR